MGQGSGNNVFDQNRAKILKKIVRKEKSIEIVEGSTGGFQS
jgi:hypothetical protein